MPRMRQLITLISLHHTFLTLYICMYVHNNKMRQRTNPQTNATGKLFVIFCIIQYLDISFMSIQVIITVFACMNYVCM